MQGDVGPELLGERIRRTVRDIECRGRVTAFPHFWQVPAATEKVAYESMLEVCDEIAFDYVAAPWATIIDGLRNDAGPAWECLRAAGQIAASKSTETGRPRATVAQHIHVHKFIDIFRACGITDLFWSHATTSQREMSGIRVHPFPLFPAQTAAQAEFGSPHAERKYLANFIGAYNPKLYLTDVRAHIFADGGTMSDLLVIKRDAWHFDRAVYSEQIKGLAPDQARLQMEERFKQEYLDAIRDSYFTLCPTGSGPNSIRIGEALALGSIPILLTRTLALPGEADLWEKACLIEEDSLEGYRRALKRAREMPRSELKERQKAVPELFTKIGPGAYADLIVSTIDRQVG